MGARIPGTVRRVLWHRAAAIEFLHVMLVEYVPFIVLLFALYTVSGGVLAGTAISGARRSSILASSPVERCMASLTGTTGASVLLISRFCAPIMREVLNVHVVIFFIFLVSNIGRRAQPARRPAALSRLP